MATQVLEKLREKRKTNGSPFQGLNAHEIGDDHLLTGLETPMRDDAFAISEEEKKLKIEYHFTEIMNALGLDLTDDSLQGTPKRVAKMYIEEIFSGLNPANKPKVALFDNKYQYNQMLVEKNITFYSNCEHHFVPIIGKAHVAYIPKERVVGLSKLARVVEVFSKRLQTQERLTMQIANTLMESLDAKGVAVTIDSTHQCMTMRGIKKEQATTVTNYYLGQFKEDLSYQNRYLRFISIAKE